MRERGMVFTKRRIMVGEWLDRPRLQTEEMQCRIRTVPDTMQSSGFASTYHSMQ
jgi:hypothetical protein